MRRPRNEGALTGLDVIVLIVNVVKDTPDFHAAAVISKAISKLVPGIYCDIGSLMADAQVAENRIKISEKVNQNLASTRIYR